MVVITVLVEYCKKIVSVTYVPWDAIFKRSKEHKQIKMVGTCFAHAYYKLSSEAGIVWNIGRDIQLMLKRKGNLGLAPG